MKGIPLLLLLLACSGSDDPAAPGRPQWLRDHEESIVQVPAHDFGQVVGGDLRFHTFLHPNDTDARWVVRDTWTGCGCVRVLAASETVDPGEALEVQVQFDPKRRRGPQEQPIFAVFDPGEQVVSFVVRAFVERASFAVPGVIIVPYGEPRARPFSIHTPDRVEPPIWIVRDGAGVVVDVGPAETVDDARGPLFVTSGELSLTEEFLQPGFSTVVRFSDVSTNSSGDVDIQVRVIAELQPALAPGLVLIDADAQVAEGTITLIDPSDRLEFLRLELDPPTLGQLDLVSSSRLTYSIRPREDIDRGRIRAHIRSRDDGTGDDVTLEPLVAPVAFVEGPARDR